MPEPKPGEPWAFVTHKDGHWADVAAANLPPKDLKKFIGGAVADGFAVTTVYSRDEYNKLLASMKCWHEHPDYKAKKQRSA